MPRYEVKLSTTINIAIVVEAETQDEAENQWAEGRGMLEQAKLAVADEVKYLDDYEFDVEDSYLIEEED